MYLDFLIFINAVASICRTLSLVIPNFFPISSNFIGLSPLRPNLSINISVSLGFKLQSSKSFLTCCCIIFVVAISSSVSLFSGIKFSNSVSSSLPTSIFILTVSSWSFCNFITSEIDNFISFAISFSVGFLFSFDSKLVTVLW